MKARNLNVLWIFLGLAVLVSLGFLSLNRTEPEGRSVNFFLQQLKADKVDRVVLVPRGEVTIAEVTLKDKQRFDVVHRSNDPSLDTQYLISEGVEVMVNSRETFNWLGLLLPISSVLMLVLFFIYLNRMRVGGGDNNGSGFARSKAHLLMEGTPKLTFVDVAGCDEAKADLVEIVDFLKSPDRFHSLGARIPHGVLLVGPPGSGKTLLAKAVSGEARVPFFSISGSDFVEMFVGVGAARVRDLFDQAKKAAPCIVFIDEIDAVGRKRGLSLGGGNDEREQTLNQLLVEMDGFESKHDIIILAATNRPDVLDPALLRPGRFDRQVVVDAPDIRGREHILRIHARKKPLEPEVDLGLVAKQTPGFVGADLENLLNEAALLAAKNKRKRITMKDIDEASDRVVMGPERKSRVISEEDKRVTAYHEVGHALAAELLPNADRVQKLTVIPRGRAAGYMKPIAEDRAHYREGVLLDMIGVALAGQAAEEMIFGEVTTGATSDFERATGIARKMVMEWGMSSEIGKVKYGSEDAEGRYSEHIAQKIDDAVRRIIDTQYERVQILLKEKEYRMHTIVEALIQRETLSGDEFRKLMSGQHLGDDSDGGEISGFPSLSPNPAT